MVRSRGLGIGSFLKIGYALCGLAGMACDDAPDWWGQAHGWGRGTGQHGGAGKAGSGGAPAPVTQPKPPPAQHACPELATGTVRVLGIDVQLWVGEKRDDRARPLLFYWHGTGSAPAEARSSLGDTYSEILAEGGVIAAPAGTTRTGQTTGLETWYTGDFAVADEIVACAIEQLGVDPRRIYAAGCSAGGLQASAMAYLRSSYLAGAMPNSGGTLQSLQRYELDEPGHVPSVIATHGDPRIDVVIVSYAEATAAFTSDIADRGGFAVRCPHEGGHCASPPEVTAAQWQFLKDHPYGVDPSPYANGLPASFPAACEIVQ